MPRQAVGRHRFLPAKRKTTYSAPSRGRSKRFATSTTHRWTSTPVRYGALHDTLQGALSDTDRDTH